MLEWENKWRTRSYNWNEFFYMNISKILPVLEVHRYLKALLAHIYSNKEKVNASLADWDGDYSYHLSDQQGWPRYQGYQWRSGTGPWLAMVCQPWCKQSAMCSQALCQTASLSLAIVTISRVLLDNKSSLVYLLWSKQNVQMLQLSLYFHEERRRISTFLPYWAVVAAGSWPTLSPRLQKTCGWVTTWIFC